LEIKHFFCTLIKQKLLNFPFYIAQRVAASGQKSFARLIIRIAIAAVALSIAVMIIASSLIKGFKSEISNKMFGFWGHIHIASTQQTTTLEPKSISANPTFLQELKTLKNVPDTEGGKNISKKGVLHVQTYAQKAGIIKTKDNFEGIVLKGVGKDFDWQFVEQSLIEGRRLQSCDTCRDILISKSTAGRMKLKVGSKFVVHFVQDKEMQQRLFQVSGIYNTGLEEYDKKFALVDIKIIQDLLGWSSNEVAGFEVFIEDIGDLEIINNYIYKEVITNDLFSESVKKEQESIFNWLDLQDVNEYIILGMMLIVSIINMVTALLILILERTNMIGLLKALGTKNWGIQQVFVYYGIIIIATGLFFGNVIGLSIAWLEKTYKFVKLPEADYYLSYAPIEFNIWYIIGLNVGTFIITTLFLLLPTLLVLSITPVKALHFK
jgi:lipoprotein-releasing system permease protein